MVNKNNNLYNSVFNFDSLLEYQSRSGLNREIPDDRRIILDCPLCLTDLQYYCNKYRYNIFKNWLKLYGKVECKSIFIKNTLGILVNFYSSSLMCVPEISLTGLKKLKEDVNKYGLKKYKEDISFDLVYSKIILDDDFFKICKDFLTDIVLKLEKWLIEEKVENLQKDLKLKYLNWLIDILGIKDKFLIDFLRIVTISNSKVIGGIQYPYFLHTNDIKLFYTACGYKYENIQLHYEKIKNYEYLFEFYEEDGKFYYNLSRFFNLLLFDNCYSDKKTFEKRVLTEIDKTDLSLKDFSQIDQINYIKTILKVAVKEKKKGINILLYGKPGVGKTALAKTLISSLKLQGYSVFKELLPNELKYSGRRSVCENNDVENDSPFFRYNYFKFLSKVCEFKDNTVLLYDEAEDFFMSDIIKRMDKINVNTALENNSIPTIWIVNDIFCLNQAYIRRFSYVLNMDEISSTNYKNIVLRLAKKYKIDLEEDTLSDITYYKPSFGLVESLFYNFNITYSKNQKTLRMDLKDKLMCLNRGEELKPKECNEFDFDINLINTDKNLNTIAKSIKEKGIDNFSMLLYGVPGTSKTSFGKYLGKYLNKKVIYKTYSELSSCWVGETEKNIVNAFNEAKKDQAILLIDEVDVLLQDRKISSHSWENTQVEALLTCMERHTYPLILTTNLIDKIDPAVMRRVTFKVKHNYLRNDQVLYAFKYFFNINLKDEYVCDNLTTGMFSNVKKQAEIEDKLNDIKWLKSALIEESKLQLKSNITDIII